MLWVKWHVNWLASISEFYHQSNKVIRHGEFPYCCHMFLTPGGKSLLFWIPISITVMLNNGTDDKLGIRQHTLLCPINLPRLQGVGPHFWSMGNLRWVQWWTDHTIAHLQDRTILVNFTWSWPDVAEILYPQAWNDAVIIQVISCVYQ